MLGRKHIRGRRRLVPARLALLFSILGPGIIAANADNDAGGIYGYSLAGAQYGYALLWVLVLVTISLGVCQEMGARMGVVTGKGLADLIREEFGVKVTFFAMFILLIANYTTTVSEFAGITASVQIFAPGAAHHLAAGVIMPVFGHVPAWLLTDEGAQRAARWDRRASCRRRRVAAGHPRQLPSRREDTAYCVVGLPLLHSLGV